MATQVDVANAALALLAAKGVTAFDNSTLTSRTLERRFIPVLNGVLSAKDWQWATGRVQLNISGDGAIAPWRYCYDRPADCLRARYLVPATSVYWAAGCDAPLDDRQPFDEGSDINSGLRYLLTDANPALLCYTRQVLDPNQWDQAFTSAFEYALAADIALAVTGRGDLADVMAQRAAGAVQAAHPDGQNTGVLGAPRRADWLAARECW